MFWAIENDLEDLVVIRIQAMRESLERLGRFKSDRSRERILGGVDANGALYIEKVSFTWSTPLCQRFIGVNPALGQHRFALRVDRRPKLRTFLTRPLRQC
ncbi:hypothetical protein [Pseudomonas simiae]|uniref:hypothetical protein n=1 Tax=Pseudomonas simiae TaxID=321846 RepID=UPI000B33E8DC|nr:hypothetical protein [Pseudomonas simiae]WLI00283.1 hypothetical protein PSH95_23285 [Pseudomonas simiae]